MSATLPPIETGSSEPSGERIRVARFGAAHGIRGQIRLKTFTGDPAAVLDYSPLTDQNGGRTFTITHLRPAGEVMIATVAEITDRNAAEALTNLDLFTERSRIPLPQDEDEFLHADLVGLRVESRTGELIGTITAIYNFGAGDILDVARPRRKGVMIPFTKAIIPTVDIAGGRVVCDPPKGLLADTPPPPGYKAQ